MCAVDLLKTLVLPSSQMTAQPWSHDQKISTSRGLESMESSELSVPSEHTLATHVGLGRWFTARGPWASRAAHPGNGLEGQGLWLTPELLNPKLGHRVQDSVFSQALQTGENWSGKITKHNYVPSHSKNLISIPSHELDF